MGAATQIPTQQIFEMKIDRYITYSAPFRLLGICAPKWVPMTLKNDMNKSNDLTYLDQGPTGPGPRVPGKWCVWGGSVL